MCLLFVSFYFIYSTYSFNPNNDLSSEELSSFQIPEMSFYTGITLLKSRVYVKYRAIMLTDINTMICLNVL